MSYTEAMSTAPHDVRKAIWQYYEEVEMPGGYYHNLPKTIKTNDLYYNSKYKTGNEDEQGFRKFFYNINKPACDVATKMIDIDTKEITLIPRNPGDEMRVWLMEKRLRQWLDDNNFGHILNDIAQELPKHGHVVIKSVRGKVYVVPIENLRVNPSSKTMRDSGAVVEVLPMTKDEMIEMGFDNLEMVEDGQHIVYEVYKKDGKRWKRCTYTNLFNVSTREGVIQTPENQINTEDMYVQATLLNEDYLDDIPYEELKWENLPGRWLGLGFVEYLEDDQIATNEAENLERKGLMFTALKLYQTRDEAVGGQNVLTSAQNGDILKIDSEITPVAMEERNLAAYNSTRNRWSESTQRKTFATDAVRGDNLPSRTPLGVVNAQVAQVAGFYKQKRDNFGGFVKVILTKHVMPSFKNDTRKQHVMTFLGTDDEISKFDRAVTDVLVEQASYDFAMSTGFFPSEYQIEDARARVESSMNRKKNRYLEIPDGFWDTVNYSMRMLVTGESMDTQGQSQILQLALQTLGANPGIIENEMTRTVFFKLLSLGGMSPVDLNLMVSQQTAQTGQPLVPGGSVAAPRAGAGAMTTNTTSMV